MPNPTPIQAKVWEKLKQPLVGWGSTDVRYKKEAPAEGKLQPKQRLKSWKGQRISAQIVISNPEPPKIFLLN